MHENDSHIKEDIFCCKNILPYAIPVVLLFILRWLFPVNFCDDAYITCRIAQNLSMGNGMVFNPAELTYVSTSPAWILLLAGLRLLIGDVLLSAQLLGILCKILLVIAVVHYSRRALYGTAVGLFAAVLLITNPVFLLTSFSGMELPLFLLVILLTANYIRQERYSAAALIASCAVWVRFDGIVIFMATIAIVLWTQRARLVKHPFQFALSMAPCIAIVLGYLVFGYILFDSCIPMSVKRKALSTPDLFSAEWLSGIYAIEAKC